MFEIFPKWGSGRALEWRFQIRAFTFMRRLRTWEGLRWRIFPKGVWEAREWGALGKFPRPGLAFSAQGAYLLGVCISDFFPKLLLTSPLWGDLSWLGSTQEEFG